MYNARAISSRHSTEDDTQRFWQGPRICNWDVVWVAIASCNRAGV